MCHLAFDDFGGVLGHGRTENFQGIDDGGERVAQLVGKQGQEMVFHLVEASQFPLPLQQALLLLLLGLPPLPQRPGQEGGGIANLDLPHEMPSEGLERFPLLGLKALPGHRIYDAQRSESMAFPRRKRHARIEADTGLPQHVGARGKAGIGQGVEHHQSFMLQDGMGAKNNIAGRFIEVEPDARLEPLAALVQQSDPGDGGVEDVAGESGNLVENRLGRRIHQCIITESLETFGLPLWQWSIHRFLPHFPVNPLTRLPLVVWLYGRNRTKACRCGRNVLRTSS